MPTKFDLNLIMSTEVIIRKWKKVMNIEQNIWNDTQVTNSKLFYKTISKYNYVSFLLQIGVHIPHSLSLTPETRKKNCRVNCVFGKKTSLLSSEGTNWIHHYSDSQKWSEATIVLPKLWHFREGILPFSVTSVCLHVYEAPSKNWSAVKGQKLLTGEQILCIDPVNPL